MRRRLVVGELAAGEPAGGRAISTSDSARREADGQARWCGEESSVHVPFLAAGRADNDAGTARGRAGQWEDESSDG